MAVCALGALGLGRAALGPGVLEQILFFLGNLLPVAKLEELETKPEEPSSVVQLEASSQTPLSQGS